MKSFIFYLTLLIDEVYKESKNKLFIAPAVISALISGAVTVGSKINADQKAKTLARKLDAQALIEKGEERKFADRGITVARGLQRQGDPTSNLRKRQIAKSAADAVGKTVASSGSTQEIINAVQGIQGKKDEANLASDAQASNFKFNASKFLADRFTAAGQLRLAGNAAIDQRLQRNLDAIGANAQGTVDSFQTLGSQLIQAQAFNKVA